MKRSLQLNQQQIIYQNRLYTFAICTLLALFVLLNYTMPLQAQAEPPTNTVNAPWQHDRAFRLPIQVAAAGYQRHDFPVELELDFTVALLAIDKTGAVDMQSLLVVEVAETEEVDDAVPFQFDQAPAFDANDNATGTLVLLLSDTTAANATRTYYLYFDLLTGATSPHTLPIFTDEVRLSTSMDEGQEALQIQTQQATYFYQTEAGGFSSLLDNAGNDWINYHPEPASSAGGAYRGIPNIVHPESGLHPGATGHQTTVLVDGPLKATIQTVINTDEGEVRWRIEWVFYPSFARATVLDYDHDYWFLYEGTPGGSLEPTEDFVVRADGTVMAAGDEWVGDFPGEEWIYFADPHVARSLYLVNHSEDDTIDSYRAKSDRGGAMTIFGFGRQGSQKYLNGSNRTFTLGLVDSIRYEQTASHIRGTYQAPASTIGVVEQPINETVEESVEETVEESVEETAVTGTTLRVQSLDGRSNQALALFHTDGHVIAQEVSNQYGKASFSNIAPGAYRLCKGGEQSCTSVTVTSEEVTIVTFGYEDHEATITTMLRPTENENLETDGELGNDDDTIIEGNGRPTATTEEELWLNSPIFAYQLYVPLVSTSPRAE